MSSKIEEIKSSFDKDAVVSAVLNSRVLGSSKHQIELFLYLMNAKNEGSISRVKAYNIAVDAFGRPSDFDGNLDSIVRVEMFRLRANLRAFNHTSKRYRLELPRASYEIFVEECTVEPSPEIVNVSLEQNKKLKSQTSTLVLTALPIAAIGSALFFNSIKKESDLAECSNAIPNISIVSKSENHELDLYVEQVIHGAASQFSHLKVVDNARICLQTGIPSYGVEYTIIQDATTYRGILAAKSYKTGELLASQNISGDLKTREVSIESVSDELYFNVVKIVNDWVKPNGLIHQNSVVADWKNKATYADYKCTALLQQYYVSDEINDYKTAHDCLEASYDGDYPSLDNLGALAVNYLDQSQGIKPETIRNPGKVAEEIIDSVGDRWVEHLETTIAKIYLESYHDDYNSQKLREILLVAEKKYSSNPVVLLYVANQLGFRLGDWDQAIRLNNKVKRLQSARDNSIYFIDAANVLMSEDDTYSMESCAKTYSENSTLSNLLVNACAVRIGDSFWITRTSSNLERLGIATTDEKLNFFRRRKFDEQFKRKAETIWKIQS